MQSLDAGYADHLLHLYSEKTMSEASISKQTPRILLIGASRGIGLAMVDEFLRRGWEVTATVRNLANDELTALSQRYPQHLMTELLDITDTLQITALYQRLSERRFDVLFINAGTANQHQDAPIATLSNQEFVEVMVTNALSPMRVIDGLQTRVKPDGLIGVMSSGQGSISRNRQGGKELYRGSKAALNQFMRSYAARESSLHPERSLLLLAPGWIRTVLGGDNAAFTLEETVPDIVNTIENRRDKPGLIYCDRFGKSVDW